MLTIGDVVVRVGACVSIFNAVLWSWIAIDVRRRLRRLEGQLARVRVRPHVTITTEDTPFRKVPDA